MRNDTAKNIFSIYLFVPYYSNIYVIRRHLKKRKIFNLNRAPLHISHFLTYAITSNTEKQMFPCDVIRDEY